MRKAISIMISAVLLMAASQSSANERVRAFVEKLDALKNTFVGQKVTIIVEVLSETHFSGATRIDLPDIAGAVFYKPEERAVVGSREIDGETFSTQRHELAFYAQRAGSFEIPSFTVRFGIAGVGGAKATDYKNQTQPLQIKVVMPPGAEKLTSLITATELKVTEVWSPELNQEFIAGNAIKRKITFTAPDIPGMVFPEIQIAPINGLKIYRDRASIHDKINRGSLVGERVDSLTYVCQTPGSYQLPAIQIQWWDLNRGELKTIQLPEVKFEVKPSPHQSSAATLATSHRPTAPWKLIFGAGVILVAIGFGIFKFRGVILNQFTEWQRHWTEGEPTYFKKIEAAQTPPEMLNSIHQWLEKLPLHTKGQTLTHFANARQQQDLSESFERLQQAIISPQSPWDKTQLLVALKQTRSDILKKNKRLTKSALSPLNPNHEA